MFELIVIMSILPPPVDVGNIHPTVISLYDRIQYKQRTPEWFEVRRGLITASESAAALGIKPFAGFKGCPREELMLTKLNNPKSFSGMAMTHGTFYEDEACDYAMNLLGKQQFEFGLLTHPTYSWLAASPDGVTADGYCVEIKCPLRRKIIPGEVPHHYYPQIQVQMEVCGLDETLFIQYKPKHMTETGDPYVDITIVKRDREWFAKHLPTLKAFHDEMEERRQTHVPQDAAPDENVCDIEDCLFDVEREYVREYGDEEEATFDISCDIVDDLFVRSREYTREFNDDSFFSDR